MIEVQPEPWAQDLGVEGFAWRVPEPKARVLLQHGYAEHVGRYVDHYGGLIPALNARGIDVFGFNMAGHGRSPGLRAGADISKTVQQHLAARLTLDNDGVPLALFGHSLGGLITAASVVERGEGVTAVVLSSPALLLRSNPLLRVMTSGIAAIAPGLGVSTPQPPSGLSRIEEEVAAFEHDPLVFHGRMPARLAATALKAAQRAERIYPSWKTPTLLMHGDEDTYASIGDSDRFFSSIASIQKSYRRVPGGRHELLNDLGREEHLAAMVDWLSAHCAEARRLPR